MHQYQGGGKFELHGHFAVILDDIGFRFQIAWFMHKWACLVKKMRPHQDRPGLPPATSNTSRVITP